MIWVRLVVVVWLATVATTAHAAPEVATFELAVAGTDWQTDAVHATLAADLAGDRLRLVERGGDLRVAITVAGRELRYVLSRDGVAPVRGTIALGSVDRRGVAGVLKDQMYRLVPHPEATRAALDVPAPAISLAAVAALGALAALLALPLVFGGFVLRVRVWRMRAAPRIGVALLAIVVAGIAIAFDGEGVAEASGLMFAVGGLAWGAVVTACLPLALPPLAGLHRVEHRELGAVLRAWLALAVQRTVGLACLLVPAGVVVWLVGEALDVPPLVTFGVIAPLVVLAARLAWRAVVELVAGRLDAALVEGDPSEAQPWHAQVRGYLVGYLHRANLEVDEERLAHVRFLPGHAPEDVAVYGGGLTHTRIVIGRVMLERALAPYGRPHDYAMPRVSMLHWTHWNSGLVMPTESDQKLATRADRDPTTSVHTSEDGEHERIAIGELPTLTGIIEPVAFDPRTSYRPDEDPAWLDWDPGEAFDGTDAGDQDLLFGVLISGLGAAQRHEDRTATLALAWRRWLAPRGLARLAERVTAPLRAFAARQTVTVADLHTALGGARHHLAQHLAWQLWHRTDLVTARAYVPQLEARSRAILAALAADPDDTDPTLRDRLTGLRRFLDPRAPVRRSQRQRVAVAFALVAAFAVVAALAVQAVSYHSTYEERRSDGKRS